MKQTTLARVRQAEKVTKPRKKHHFGRGTLTETADGYTLEVSISEKWFNEEITDIITESFPDLTQADAYLDELKKRGYHNIIVLKK